jgi:N-acetylglucosamine kinase-like BadF-type ATPase
MNYYIGIDGGGTKTKVNVNNEQEEIVLESLSGPSSIDTVSEHETYQAFLTALKPFYDQVKKPVISGFFVGLGGIVSEKDCLHVEAIVRKLPFVTSQTKVKAKNDMENALYSGLLFDEGIALICGTGMGAFGKNKEGKTHKAGGWGFKEGDLGSSYDLGMRSLRHVIKAFDGREKKTDFSMDIAQTINMKDTEDFVDIMHTKYLDRTWIASLAPLVTKHALLQDEIALQIVKDATKELATAVYAVKTKLQITHPTLVIVGSLGHAQGYHEELIHQLKKLIPEIKTIKPQVDPAYAASLMAKRLI